MKQKIPRILFAAPSSGSGKTMVTCGFLRLCQRRQLNCRSMKCGPDYIDLMFHNYILGIPGANLDSFFLEEDKLKALFFKTAAGCDIAVIEGVMGYYDGVAGISTQASTYDIARITNTPVILIVDGKKGSLSLAALIKGFIEYRSDSGICGVILNRTSSVMAKRLRPQIEALGIRLAGWIPECEEAKLESRHLGLTLPGEQEALKLKIEQLADKMAQGLDMEWLLQIARGVSEARGPMLNNCQNPDFYLKGRHGSAFRLAVARDEAFSFYYQENLELLKEAGAELLFYSPLHDGGLPEDLDGILLGGGYPELYAGELSENHGMLEALRRASVSGVKILAECGGFLYLHQTLEGSDGNSYRMAGILEGHGFRTEKLSRFGYLTLQSEDGAIKGHEFHYWDSDNTGIGYKAVKPLTGRSWPCMHRTETLLAGFPHLYYPSNRELIYRFLNFEEAPGE